MSNKNYQDLFDSAEYLERTIQVHRNTPNAEPPSELVQKRWLETARQLCECEHPDLQKRGQLILEDIQNGKLFRKKSKVFQMVFLCLFIVCFAAIFSHFVFSKKSPFNIQIKRKKEVAKKTQKTSPSIFESKKSETPSETVVSYAEMSLEELTSILQKEHDTLSDEDYEEVQALIYEKYEEKLANSDTEEFVEEMQENMRKVWSELSEEQQRKADLMAQTAGFDSMESVYDEMFNPPGYRDFSEAWYLSVVPAFLTLICFIIVFSKMNSVYKELDGKISSEEDLAKIKKVINADMMFAMCFKVAMIAFLVFTNYWYFTDELTTTAFLGHSFLFSGFLMLMVAITKPILQKFRKMKASHPSYASKFNEWLLLWEEPLFKLPDNA